MGVLPAGSEPGWAGMVVDELSIGSPHKGSEYICYIFSITRLKIQVHNPRAPCQQPPEPKLKQPQNTVT